MTKKNIGTCKDCIVYAMCKDMCEEANGYISHTIESRIVVDDWTWAVMVREHAHTHSEECYEYKRVI